MNVLNLILDCSWAPLEFPCMIDGSSAGIIPVLYYTDSAYLYE